MSEPKTPETGSEEPELTPAEQQQEDKERVAGQLIVTDVTRQMQDVMEVFGLGSGGSSGRTSFEGHDLNAMIDLIENSKPEHLEEAGKALLKARSAMDTAAGELEGFIDRVDWEGESGTAFSNWGKGLVAHARKLGAFAEVAGTQITVAGTGLASVRNSLPPRDSRLVRKSPEDIESPARIEENPEYAAALKVEKDRQEAINQANRLASYYAVSEETLAAQEPPRFEKKLDVAMPRPTTSIGVRPSETGNSTGDSGASGSIDSGGVSHQAVTGRPGSSESGQGFETPAAVPPVPERGVSTEIDSVATPPAPVTTSSTTPPAPTTGPAGPGGGQNLPLANGFVNPLTNSSRALQTSTGAPRAVGQAGGNARTGSGPTSNSRTTGPQVGRPSPMNGGTSSARGVNGPQSPTAGRSGVTGGRPTSVGHASTSGTSAPRAGRSGIVGGTPQRSAPGTTGGTRGGSRGTVIGAGGAARPGGPASGVGQRGVVGSANAPRPAGRGTPSTNGVVGTPRGGPARPGAGAKGFTAGGAGLVRGPAGRKDSKEEDQDDGTPRPDYLTEDRETWEAGRRGVAPPVIE
ncbi:WXG100 family type VII secretion target [Streptomyces sp. NPDC017201]|uniref:WXG100 family type VII secretion target n=1 Tax=unclassified Streptomyces TaxID=2593676 RepID=UPI0029A236B7|nr:hypothetical protein [Streptomyces sp. AK04-4c]MDX3683353.1 hypothetical protein [Streptomyces sp. AK04-4c]